MDFSEKLNYLFELCHAEGRELAAAMNITPPQISKMRRGGRGLPKNREAAETLARFFAQRCSSDFQRDSLSRAIRVAQIRNIDKESELTDILLHWLSDEKDPNEYAAKCADDFLQLFSKAESGAGADDGSGEPRKVLSSSESNLMVFFGREGKRLATETFFNYLTQRAQSYTIDLLTDESIGWINEDADFSRRLQTSMLRLTKQGCCFRRIAGPIMDMDQAFESLRRWFPLYLTGKATSYYFKRMRDNLNRVTIFVVPGVAVMFSLSVGNYAHKDGVTFFTTDKATANSMAVEFESYLSMCEPIMNVYSVNDSIKKMHACMLNYESCRGDCLQRSSSLSFITLPWEVATSIQTSGPPEEKAEFLNSFAQRHKRFIANLTEYNFTDIIRLADLKSIMEENILIPGAYVLNGKPQYYTVDGYVTHLRNVLFLLEHFTNYKVILRTDDDLDPTIIYVKEGYCAVLTLPASSFSIFEVSERYLVDAFAEYTRRLIPNGQSEVLNRRAVIKRLRALIEQVEGSR